MMMENIPRVLVSIMHAAITIFNLRYQRSVWVAVVIYMMLRCRPYIPVASKERTACRAFNVDVFSLPLV